MTDTLTPLGELSYTEVLPGPAAALAISLPKLQAELDALMSFTFTPPSISADIALATQILANLNLNVGITPPDVSAQAAIVADLIAQLLPQVNLVLGLVNLLATAGVHLYAYTGSVAGLGTTLNSALASGLPGGGGAAEACAGVVAVATATAAVGAMPQIFKMS